ncbi:hypothetical protein O9G_005493 [Rozella allomycis CSF55]|uniref:Uncharacterized protein n=1 Tax=Rozella allomycis (strain CSF55) TaxID=988480 RepID=A0A075B1G5_ROZAC|nr:hypothetical protein O9G_005493 [Rozella allomycis CSF55]|eukprot:EPZ36431.1 hypothetical protein O9G_005493 [Rozella allomycis CSF55]
MQKTSTTANTNVHPPQMKSLVVTLQLPYLSSDSNETESYSSNDDYDKQNRLKTKLSRDQESFNETLIRQEKDRRQTKVTREQESADKTLIRQEKNRIQTKLAREQESADKTSIRQDTNRLRTQHRRDEELTSDRLVRLEKLRVHSYNTRLQESQTEKETRLLKNRLQTNIVRNQESYNDRLRRLGKNRVQTSQARDHESEYEKARRLATNTASTYKAREEESSQERAERLERNQQKTNLVRSLESSTQRLQKNFRRRQLRYQSTQNALAWNQTRNDRFHAFERDPTVALALFYNNSALLAHTDYVPTNEDRQNSTEAKIQIDTIIQNVEEIPYSKKSKLINNYMAKVNPTGNIYACACCGIRDFSVTHTLSKAALSPLKFTETQEQQYISNKHYNEAQSVFLDIFNNELYHLHPELVSITDSNDF